MNAVPDAKAGVTVTIDATVLSGVASPDVRSDLAFVQRIISGRQFWLRESADQLGYGPTGPLMIGTQPLHGAWAARAENSPHGPWYVSIVANNGWPVDLSRHSVPGPEFAALRPLNFALAWAGWAAADMYRGGTDIALDRVAASLKPMTVGKVESSAQLSRLKHRAQSHGLAHTSRRDDVAGDWWFAAARSEPLHELAQLDELGRYLSDVAPAEVAGIQAAIASLDSGSPEDRLEPGAQEYLWGVAAGDDVCRKVIQCALFGYWPPVTASFTPSVQRAMRGLKPVQSARIKDHIPALWNLGYASLARLKRETCERDTKPGRNDPCPCGSGKKYKRCHAG